MTTQRNDKNFGGRYLIQDQDNMSEIRRPSELETTRAARQAHLKPSTRQAFAKRNWVTAPREVSHASTK